MNHPIVINLPIDVGTGGTQVEYEGPVPHTGEQITIDGTLYDVVRVRHHACTVTRSLSSDRTRVVPTGSTIVGGTTEIFLAKA